VSRRELAESLCVLPGIGAWTASYVAMRALSDPDAFLSTDLGIRTAAARLGLSSDLDDRSSHWRPWRAYAAAHLWHTLARVSERS
jgi:AraC family transcriptional regulator of adaptative response / DNA-3-methyladenine glycosylase II